MKQLKLYTLSDQTFKIKLQMHATLNKEEEVVIHSEHII
jgi:hypothetical protein